MSPHMTGSKKDVKKEAGVCVCVCACVCVCVCEWRNVNNFYFRDSMTELHEFESRSFQNQMSLSKVNQMSCLLVHVHVINDSLL